MKYSFDFTYTPDDVSKDRIRKDCVVETGGGIEQAIKDALNRLKMSHLTSVFLADFHDGCDGEDISEGSAFITLLNNGEWEVEWDVG